MADPVWNGTVWVDDLGNTYDPNEGIWRDPRTGNWMDTSGVWHSPQGTVYVNNQWVQPGATTTGTSAGNGGVQVTPGVLQDILNQSNAQQTHITNLSGQTSRDVANIGANATLEAQRISTESTQRIAQLTAEVNREIAKGNNASAERIAALQHEIGVENNRIALINAQTSQAAEARAERELQARLGANPNDLVAYELYKRAIGNPTTISVLSGGGTGAGGAGSAAGGAGSNPAGASVPGGVSEYYPAPSAYSDNTLQDLVAGLQQESLDYTPWLQGEGIFGANIPNPNSVSRSEYGSWSEQERGILDSFLKAGININGSRVAINPEDYWEQTQKSWIPTLASIGGVTQYR